MLRMLSIATLAFSPLLLTGCGSQSPAEPAAQTQAPADVEGPDKAVFKFLEAVRTGNEKIADEMLTPTARQKTKELEMVVAPPGSDTASFEVDSVEMVAEDGAHVSCVWSDVDESGERRSDSIIWMVRREFDGWRIAGMATKVFEDQPPLFLNFEDPEDMLRKQQMLQAEIERRSQPATLQAAQPGPATAQPTTTQ
ncbi:MAG: hypothetical protein KF708_10025 [Pirellulales bacterium]|nr:hypothetical protein [Pirellulales bacterium]